MEFLQYRDSYKDLCLQLFDSNVGKYFAHWERNEFSNFLELYVSDCQFFVVKINSSLVACGGFAEEEGIVELIWGMVRRDLHGKSIGKFLLSKRIELIREMFEGSVVKIDTSQHTKAFYSKYGFKETSTEQDGYDLGLDKVYMEYLICS